MPSNSADTFDDAAEAIARISMSVFSAKAIGVCKFKTKLPFPAVRAELCCLNTPPKVRWIN